MAKRRRKKSNIDLSAAREQQQQLEELRAGSSHEHTVGQWDWYVIMPPFPGANVPWLILQRHAWLNCPKTHDPNEPCFTCDKLQEKSRQGDYAYVDKFQTQTKGIINAVRKQDIKKLRSKPTLCKTLMLSPKIMEKVIDKIVNSLNNKDLDITDPSSMMLFGIKRTGTGKATRYEHDWGKVVNVSKFIDDDVLEACLLNLEMVKDARPASTKKMREVLKEWEEENGGGYNDSGSSSSGNWDDDEDFDEDLFGDSDDVGDFGDDIEIEDDFDFGDSEEVDADFEETPKPRRRKRRKRRS